MSRVCNKCKRDLPSTSFNKCQSSKDGLQYTCRECQVNYQKAKYQNNPEYRERRKEIQREWERSNYDPRKERNKRYLQKYGMSIEDYNLLLKEQDNSCAICGESNRLDSLKRGLHVDHDHKTMQVRGLLCQQCNTALGSFKDDVDILKSAISYLTKKGI